jgi:hypothetical protein
LSRSWSIHARIAAFVNLRPYFVGSLAARGATMFRWNFARSTRLVNAHSITQWCASICVAAHVFTRLFPSVLRRTPQMAQGWSSSWIIARRTRASSRLSFRGSCAG